MPRSNRPRRSGRPRPRPAAGPPAAAPRAGVGEVRYAGQVWAFRQVRANDSGRVYVCPGCQQEVGADVPHTVAWPAASMRELDNRRHWHSTCWAARERRRPPGSFA